MGFSGGRMYRPSNQVPPRTGMPALMGFTRGPGIGPSTGHPQETFDVAHLSHDCFCHSRVVAPQPPALAAGRTRRAADADVCGGGLSSRVQSLSDRIRRFQQRLHSRCRCRERHGQRAPWQCQRHVPGGDHLAHREPPLLTGGGRLQRRRQQSVRTERGPRQNVVAWLGALDEAGRLGVQEAARSQVDNRADAGVRPSSSQLALFEFEDEPTEPRVSLGVTGDTYRL